MPNEQEKDNVIEKQTYGSPEFVCLGDALELTNGGPEGVGEGTFNPVTYYDPEPPSPSPSPSPFPSPSPDPSPSPGD
jgi:hypothetical protein